MHFKKWSNRNQKGIKHKKYLCVGLEPEEREKGRVAQGYSLQELERETPGK